jgi:hypothetical protein
MERSNLGRTMKKEEILFLTAQRNTYAMLASYAMSH